jgi:sialidase-1
MKLRVAVLALASALALAAAPVRFPADLRVRAIKQLRQGFAAEEFWPSMHAAEGLALAGFGASVAYELRPRIAKETDDQHRCGLARETIRGGDATPVPVLATVLRNTASNGRIHAAESLFKVGQTGDAKVLREAAAGDDPIFALMAAAALVRSGERDQLARIRAILHHQDARARRTAAWVLGQIGEPKDLPVLREQVTKETEPLSVCFFWNALAKLGDMPGRNQSLANLTSDDPAIRTYSAQTVGVWGSPAQLPALAKALGDDNLDTRIRAAEGIVRITNRMLAQDADKDGIPDSVEQELGTPPNDPETLTRFYTAKPKGPGQQDPEALPPELVGAWFGHVGGDRFVWVYEFGDTVSELRTIFHSYLRLDGDDSTGRQGGASQGVDFMYSFVDAHNDPRVFTKQLRVRQDWPVRGLVAGNRIYVCDDVRIQQTDGKARATIHLLSERYPNDHTKKKVGKGTSPVDVLVPLRTKRVPPPLDFPETSGFRVLSPSFAARYALRYGEGSVQLNIAEGDGTGFERHYDGYIQSVSGQPGEMALTVPVSGTYHLAFLGTGTGGVTGLEVELSGRLIGTVATGRVDDPGTLFVSPKLRVRKGDRLTVRTVDRAGAGRFGDVTLAKEEPEIPPLAIGNLSSAVLPARPGQKRDRVEVVWTTNVDATCEIKLTAGRRSETFPVPDGPGINHRFFVPDEFLLPDCRAVVAARSGEDTVTAEPLHVAVRRPDPGRHAHQSGRIALTVAEPAAKGRLSWPVTSGVPFVQGVLADGSRCRVLDAAGRPLPAQFRELARWPDGSVKWLLVDTLVDTKAGQGTALTLAYNVEPFPAGGVTVSEPAGGIVVKTAGLELRLDRKRFEPLGGATAGALEIADPDGNVFTSANLPPEEMVVEERGPVRATVRVRGQFADAKGNTWLRYLCRIHVHASQPWARLEVSLDNDALDPTMSRIARFELPLAATGQPSFGVQAGKALLQDYDNRYLVDGKPQAGHAPGYCSVGPLTVAVRDFWQLYPKGFRADGKTLRVQLLPPLPSDQYQNEADKKLEDRLYFWCDKGTYKIRTGVRLTTELAVSLSPQTAPADLNEWFQHPLFAVCTPDAYCATGVWGAMTPRREGDFVRYEHNVDQAFDDFLARREKVREYGFMNFGDWYGERTWNWGNVEYDTPFALAIHFLRVGDRRMLNRAEEAAAHNGDVDTTHYDTNPSNVGRSWTHCIGHTGGYYPSDFRGMGGFNTGPRGTGHTWCRGHFLLWNLTGNERYHEAGRMVAHYQAAVAPRNPRIGTHRDGGWTLVGAIGAYQGTGDPYYLNGARMVVNRILDKQRPNGQWGHPIWECRDEYPRPWGCKPFMTGVILHALSIFDRTEPTPLVQDAIRRGAAYLWEKTYVPDQHGFIYAEAPRFQGKGGIWTMTLVGDGLAYACRLDSERRYRDLLLDGLSHNMYRGGVSSFGKGFTQGLCFTVYMLNELERLGIRNPPPVVSPPNVRLRSHIVLPPEGATTIRPQLKLDGDGPAPCSLAFGGEAKEHIVEGTTISWQATPGLTMGPEIHVRAPAKPGVVVLPISLSVGEKSEKRELKIEAIAPAPISGKATGWVTDAKDPLQLAARKLGLPVSAIADLAKADLDQFSTIVIGDEAHEKNFAGCRAAAGRLNRWVLAGGTLLVGQLNDGNWLPDFLPFDLALDDDDTRSGNIQSPGHPLFQNLKPAALAGTMSYDRIAWAAPEWHTLMQAEDGTPSILAATFGTGRVLVIMPSFDREVPKDTSPACTALIRSFLRAE